MTNPPVEASNRHLAARFLPRSALHAAEQRLMANVQCNARAADVSGASARVLNADARTSAPADRAGFPDPVAQGEPKPDGVRQGNAFGGEPQFGSALGDVLDGAGEQAGAVAAVDPNEARKREILALRTAFVGAVVQAHRSRLALQRG